MDSAKETKLLNSLLELGMGHLQSSPKHLGQQLPLPQHSAHHLCGGRFERMLLLYH